MNLNTDHLNRCIGTLRLSLNFYEQAPADSIDREIFRNAIVKGYELAQETSFKLLKKALRDYGHADGVGVVGDPECGDYYKLLPTGTYTISYSAIGYVTQTIPGITGGALDSDEGAPGPIYLQGDHGAVSYRNLRITPAVPAK